MKTISGLTQTTRLTRSIGVAILLVLFSTSPEYGLSALFFLTFSFAFNDWVDADKDAIGHPNRAIPSGKVTRHQVLLLSAALLVLGIVWSVLFVKEFALDFAFIYFLSVLYSWFLKPNLPLLATPTWSTAVAILLVQPFTTNPLVFLAAMLIVYAYELLLDYRDRVADKKFCRTTTLANLLGKGTYVVAGVCFLIAVAILVQNV